MDGGSGVTSATNHLLEALPAAENQRLMRALTPLFLDVKTVLFEPGRTIDSVYFPLNGVVSLVTPLKRGAVVEVAATVGNEGIVGVPLVLMDSLAIRAITAVAGWVMRIDAADLVDEVERNGPLRELVNDYIEALFGQISQAAACNRLHSSEERLSRWLLMSQDRVGADEFAITPEFLGEMLVSRRATVTLSAGILQAAGVIRYHRGRVTIIDRAGLESMSCECYGVIRAELDRVVKKALRRAPGDRGLPLSRAQAVDAHGDVEITGAASRVRPTVRRSGKRR
jgi:CRP-like cAMP-binding protein